MRAAALLIFALAWPAVGHAKDRPLTFCLEDGEGGSPKRGMVTLWSEKLGIERDAENAFKVDREGCVEVTSLAWNGARFPLQAWLSVTYEATAPGFYPVTGTVQIAKKKRRNTKIVLMERKLGSPATK